jgi:uracil-DNA glycosylase
MNSKTEQLNALAKEIIDAKVTPDLADSSTQLVFGEGNSDSDIVFIGEAPGKNEDIQGRPFVGAAGKFLNEMLETIGLKRAMIYITNIVKYRPPSNRDPLPEEKAIFLPYLLRQLEIINPKLIVTLGRHSMDVMLPGLKISQVHGQPKRINLNYIRQANSLEDSASVNLGIPDSKSQVIMPLFHPAAALYNGGLRQTLIDDFSKIPLVLKKI